MTSEHINDVDYLEQEEEEYFYDIPYEPIMRPDAASCTAVLQRMGLFTGVLSFFGSMFITNALYGERANLGRYVRTGLVGKFHVTLPSTCPDSLKVS
ncbi:hypothetical protein Gasu2_48800 [Galdieria sulphuraria]|nr:hypothetical protein Gasu2_48800 [Galdieria sulphuraria]